MSVILEIRDGVPNWWNSPDIWVVPGSDPAGSPGQPIAGNPAYLWGRVRNNGDTQVNGVRVNFYWSNPATGVLRSNSTLIGSAFADLDAGETQDVLCLTPWVPTVVNDGHECVVAEAIHASDPLPTPLPDAFDPPNLLQIAQRNLSVLAMKSSKMVMTVQIAVSEREKQALEITAEIGEELGREVLMQLGLEKIKFAKEPMGKIDLSLDRGCESEQKKGGCCDRIHLDVVGGVAQAVYLKVMPHKMRSGYYTPINVVARNRDQVVGGVTFVAVKSEEG